jgi:ADP-ribose pyrophosphatase YjhB (NUDIX family)
MENQLRRYNRYQDVEINAAMLPHDELGRFLPRLAKEEEKWMFNLRNHTTDSGIRRNALFWVKVPVRLVHLLPSLLGTGVFTVHHATSEYFMLVKSAEGASHGPPSPPLYGSHYCRVECIVIDRGQTPTAYLVVNENIGVVKALHKFITGSVESGEYISQAAVREVREEARVDCRFVGVLGLINRTLTRFGKDEILIGCLMEADPTGQVPAVSSSEITKAEWVTLEGLLGSPQASMTQKWLEAAAAISVCKMHEGGLAENIINDAIRGYGRQMAFYEART